LSQAFIEEEKIKMTQIVWSSEPHVSFLPRSGIRIELASNPQFYVASSSMCSCVEWSLHNFFFYRKLKKNKKIQITEKQEM